MTPIAESLYGYPVAEFFHNPHLWRSLIHHDGCDCVENRIFTLKGTGFPGEKSFMNYPDFHYAASDGFPNISETAFKTLQFCWSYILSKGRSLSKTQIFLLEH